MNFFETSAKDATNVEKAFQELIYQINDVHLKTGANKTQENDGKVKLEGRPVVVNDEDNLANSKKSGCCSK